MVKLIERQEALLNPNLRREVSTLQNDFYTDWIGSAETDEQRQAVEEQFDARAPQERSPDSTTTIFYHPSVNLEEYPQKLATSLKTALQSLGTANVYCVAHVRVPLFGNLDNAYAPLKKAYRGLKTITKSMEYREGFRVDLDSLEEFIPILFWIARCDASAPEYMLINPENDLFVGFLCKYGNLHITFQDSQLAKEVTKELVKAGLAEWQENEYDRFSKDSGIKGRTLKL